MYKQSDRRRSLQDFRKNEDVELWPPEDMALARGHGCVIMGIGLWHEEWDVSSVLKDAPLCISRHDKGIAVRYNLVSIVVHEDCYSQI